MSKSKTALLVGAGVVTIGAAGVGSVASATNKPGNFEHQWGLGWHWQSSEKEMKFDADLASKLSTRYNLDKNELASVIEEVRDDQFTILNKDRQAKLEKALEDNSITDEQYTKIIARINGIDGLYDKVDDVSGKERKRLLSDIQQEFRELFTYLKENNLKKSLVGFSENDRERKRHDHR